MPRSHGTGIYNTLDLEIDMIQKKHPPSLLKPKNRGIT